MSLVASARNRMRALTGRPQAVTPDIRFDPASPAVVLSPHADDAVLGCFSVLEAGSPHPRVVNVCGAIPPAGSVGAWDAVTGAADSAARMEERLREDREALGALGVDPLGLDFLDAQYRPPDQRLDASAVLHALAHRLPVTGRVYAPLGIGGQPDHVAAREVAIELARRGFEVELYAELPYATEWGWPRWVHEVSDHGPPELLDGGAYWAQVLEAVPWPTDRLRARVERLPDSVGERKLAALRTYRTQFPALDLPPLERLSHPLWRRYEVFWSVLPAG